MLALPTPPVPTPIERLLAKVQKDPETGCWDWTAANDGRHGYGMFWLEGRQVRAHRASYILHRSDIPAEMTLDHLCRNTACVNPAHLEVVTQAENIRRGDGPGAWRRKQLEKTHCPQGHPYSDENTYHHPNGSRQCRACGRARDRRRRAA